MPPILGYFVFISLGHGILGSKFGHRTSNRLLSESATMLADGIANDPFIGLFESSWFDEVSAQTVASTVGRLRITWRGGPNTGQYLLTWTNDTNGTLLFQGEGM